MQPWAVALLVTTAAAVGFLGGLFLDAETLTNNSISHAAKVHVSRLQSYASGVLTATSPTSAPPFLAAAAEGTTQQYHRVLSRAVWQRSMWGKDCASPKTLTSGQQALCQLPQVWKNCTQGIYLDMGTNVGAQIRKLYDPQQFPGAGVLGLFNETYGFNHSGVCALGVEANPMHTPYLTKLNAYFKSKGYQALVLTETAASISTGRVAFHLDHGSPVEWGASLAAGSWQGRSNTTSNEATVWTLDLPAFFADVVRPLVTQSQRERGIHVPVGMKMDVEGEEYALLPGLITNGGLCDLSMIYLEPHREEFKSEAGKAVGMNIPAMEQAFAQMRKANSKCTVKYTHLDDESYLHADTEVPLTL